MFDDILAFVRSDPKATYKLIIGTDSQPHDELLLVTAIVIHRLGKGARYYYRKHYHRKLPSLRQKIYLETSLSLGVASDLAGKLAETGQALDIEIHLDIGPTGESRDLIREIVGMVAGSGFDAKIKPESFGASKVADKHTK